MDEQDRERILNESREHVRWCRDQRAEWAAREADPLLEGDRRQAEYQREREQRSPSMRRDDPGGLVYRQRDDTAQVADETDWSAWERWLQGHLEGERASMLEAIGEALAAERQRARRERAEEVAALQIEVARLSGKLDAVLALQQGKSGGDVLPLRKVQHNG